MVILRKAVLDAFAESLRSDYLDRMANRIRTVFPDYYYRATVEQVRAFIADSIAKAAEFGLDEESTVGRFMDYRLLYGMELERVPERVWFLRTLADSGVSQSERIYEIDMAVFGYSLEPESHAG